VVSSVRINGVVFKCYKFKKKEDMRVVGDFIIGTKNISVEFIISMIHYIDYDEHCSLLQHIFKETPCYVDVRFEEWIFDGIIIGYDKGDKDIHFEMEVNRAVQLDSYMPYNINWSIGEIPKDAVNKFPNRFRFIGEE
jgi:hypothetical protein